jgi:hypothetical protein
MLIFDEQLQRRIRMQTKHFHWYRAGKITFNELADNIVRSLVFEDDRCIYQALNVVDKEFLKDILQRFDETIVVEGFRPSAAGLVDDFNDQNLLNAMEEKLEPKYRYMHSVLQNLADQYETSAIPFERQVDATEANG